MDRPILKDEAEGSDLSPTTHLLLGISIVCAYAAKIRNEVDLENLAHYCRAVLSDMSYRQEVIDSGLAIQLPEHMTPTQVATATRGATRGLKLAEAAQAFLAVYDEVNRS